MRSSYHVTVPTLLQCLKFLRKIKAMSWMWRLIKSKHKVNMSCELSPDYTLHTVVCAGVHMHIPSSPTYNSHKLSRLRGIRTEAHVHPHTQINECQNTKINSRSSAIIQAVAHPQWGQTTVHQSEKARGPCTHRKTLREAGKLITERCLLSGGDKSNTCSLQKTESGFC